MEPIIVNRGRTKLLSVSIDGDVSNDTFTSEIRTGKDQESDLIIEWGISFATDGTDGELILILDELVTSDIEQSKGYMDIKRVIDGEPINVFDEPPYLIVLFTDTITE